MPYLQADVRHRVVAAAVHEEVQAVMPVEDA
jgi:hypothetical protein